MKVESPVTLPVDSVPSKCEDLSLDALAEFIEFHSNQLSFEKWVQARLEETCMVSTQYDVLLDDLQYRIDKAKFDKTALTTWFYKQTGEAIKEHNPEIDDLVDYALYLRTRFNEAVADGTFVSEFKYEGEIPSKPEGCGAIVKPFEDAIQEKIAELKDLEDCMEFIMSNFCPMLNELALKTKKKIKPVLEDKAIESVQNLQVLFPVRPEESETNEEFAARLYNEYIAEVTAGTFDPVEIEFSTPSEEIPEGCKDVVDYSGLQKLIIDTQDAFSFDAWLQAAIDRAT